MVKNANVRSVTLIEIHSSLGEWRGYPVFFALVLVIQRNYVKFLGPCLGRTLEERELGIDVRHGKCSQQPQTM